MRRRYVALALACLLAPCAAGAQKRASGKPSAPRLSAQAVIQRFVQATGGATAYASTKSAVLKGTVSIPAQGIQGTFEIYTREPGKFYTIQRIQGMGDMEQGFDGKVGWSRDPINGLRTLQGKELALLKVNASQDSPLKWRRIFQKIEMLGVRKVNGRDAYALRMTARGLKPITQYFDAKTFLLTRLDLTTEGPQGVLPTESYMGDYRKVGSLKMPFKTRIRVGGIAEMVMTVTDARVNVPVDDSLFARPSAK